MFQPNFKAAFDLNNVYNQCKISAKKTNCDAEDKLKANNKEKNS